MNGSIVDSGVGKLLFPQESIRDTGGCRRRKSMFMAAITTTKLLLLLCLFALLALAMEMMPLQAQSAGTSCGVLIALVYMVCENYFLLPFYCKMAIFKKGQKIRHMMHFGFIIKLVCCLGWLCGLAFGQAELSDALTGSVTFPALGVTCIGNLAVFYRCILRGPPKLDIGAKDVLTTVTGRKLKKINELEDLDTYHGEGLTTCPNNLEECHVLMLSKQMSHNSSMQQFMEYMSNVHNLNSVFLQLLRLEDVSNTVEIRIMGCIGFAHGCQCIVFDTFERITLTLADRMPGILKRLSDSQCLLPCESCLRDGCHGCNQGLLRVQNDTLIEGDPQVESPAAVCSLLDYFGRWPPSDGCICIPVHSASDDEWTKQLITLLELKGNKARGRISVSSALENYIAGSGEYFAYEKYNIFSLIIVPMLTEVLINIALTFWFKADGFSSALLARRAMEDYLPGHSGGGFSPIAFLIFAAVKSSENNRNVCQVLHFRGSRLSLRPLYFMMGFVNLICSITWIVLVALEGGANKWYHTHSMPLSKARVIVIIIAISFSLGMGLSHWLLYESQWSFFSHSFFSSWQRYVRLLRLFMICMIVLEILCIVSWSTVLGTLGMKPFGRWLYAALQCLVWIKWGFANYLTNQLLREEMPLDGDYLDGRYLYASPFFLNAILAGVRAKWEFS